MVRILTTCLIFIIKDISALPKKNPYRAGQLEAEIRRILSNILIIKILQKLEYESFRKFFRNRNIGHIKILKLFKDSNYQVNHIMLNSVTKWFVQRRQG